MLESPVTGVEDEEVEDDDDPFASQPPRRANKPASPEPNVRKQKISEDLLLVLLHEFFPAKEGETGVRIKKDAARAVGKYMDTFVREAIARAAYGREEVGGGGELEVEDLEKLAPQLLLDF
jgi:centromere protein X